VAGATVYDRRVATDEPRGTLLQVEAGPAISDRAERTVRELYRHPMIDVTWSRYEPGERGPDPHVHHEHVDAFYVVEGELAFGLGPDVAPVRASAGTFVLVPPDVTHTFGNESDATARWLNFHAPSTGFIASLRGEIPGFDSFDAPADGGRPAADAVVVAPGAGELLRRSDRTIAILGEHPLLSALEIAFDDGFTVDPHTHDDEVDSFFVLAGAVEFLVAREPVTAGPGTWVSAPSHAVHRFRNVSGAPARVLNVHAPEVGFVARVRG
jgi:quercetin dioxygenase-like cupin family protein